jgi:hypothetical protein
MYLVLFRSKIRVQALCTCFIARKEIAAVREKPLLIRNMNCITQSSASREFMLTS